MDNEETPYEQNPSRTQETEPISSSPDDDYSPGKYVFGKQRRNSEHGDSAAKQVNNEQCEGSSIEAIDKHEMIVDELIVSEESESGASNFENSEKFVVVSVVPVGKETQSDQEDIAGTEIQKSTDNSELMTDGRASPNCKIHKGYGVTDSETELSKQCETESVENPKKPTNTNESVSRDPWINVKLEDNNNSGYIADEIEDRSIDSQTGNTFDLPHVQTTYKDSTTEPSVNGANETQCGSEANDQSLLSKSQMEQPQQYKSNVSHTENEAEKEETTEHGEKEAISLLLTCAIDDDNDHDRNIDISSVHGSEELELIGNETGKEHNTSTDEEELKFNNQLDSLSPVNDIADMESDHPLSEKNVLEQNVLKEMERLSKENKTLQETRSSQADYLNGLQENNKKLEEELKESKVQLNRDRETYQQESEKMRRKQENTIQQMQQSWSETLESIQTQITDKEEMIQELAQKQFGFLQENNENLDQITCLNEKIVQMEKEIKTLNEKIVQMEKEIKTLENDKEKEAKIIKKQNDQIKDLKQQLNSEKDRQKAVQKYLGEERDKVNKLQTKINMMNQQYTNEWKRREHEHHANMEKRKVEYENSIRTKEKKWEATEAALNKTINEQRNVHENLLLRYSKLAGESLTVGNANVTDLSDPNRPTKLAEQFSELYDNEWTDAFEELDDINDLEKINYLLLILQRAYELSSEITTSDWLNRCYYTTFTKYKNAEINAYGNDFEENGNQGRKVEDSFEECAEDNIAAENENQRTKDEDSFEECASMNEKQKTEDNDIADLRDKENTSSENENQGTKDEDSFEECASENDQQMIGDDSNRDMEERLDATNDQQTIGKDGGLDLHDRKKRDPENDQQMIGDDSNRDMEERLDACTDLYAESSVDPPTETNVDSTQVISEGTSVDPVTDTTIENKEPVRRGKLNSLEVPDKESKNEREQQAIKMFTHIKKKILACASNKLQSIITNCLVEELDIPTQAETALLVFVKKCSELCLMMGLKDPPLYIDFMKKGMPNQTLFNAEQYKAYTRKGKYLQYVVWPCLFLEKDGPLLSKGTAQGRND